MSIVACVHIDTFPPIYLKKPMKYVPSKASTLSCFVSRIEIQIYLQRFFLVSWMNHYSYRKQRRRKNNFKCPTFSHMCTNSSNIELNLLYDTKEAKEKFMILQSRLQWKNGDILSCKIFHNMLWYVAFAINARSPVADTNLMSLPFAPPLPPPLLPPGPPLLLVLVTELLLLLE